MPQVDILSADVLVLDRAFPRRIAKSMAGEESAMILVHVGVAVVPGCEHEIEVSGEPCARFRRQDIGHVSGAATRIAPTELDVITAVRSRG